MYAIPLDTHPFVLFYNTEVCEKAGLLDSDGQLKPIEGEDAFVDALRRAKEVTGAYGATHGINADPPSPWRVFQTFYSQLGGEVLADDGTSVVLDDAKARGARLHARADRREGADPQPPSTTRARSRCSPTGRPAFYLNGEWEITTFQTAKMPFSMTRVPNLFGGHATPSRPTRTRSSCPAARPDSAQLDRSLGFVRSMLDQSVTWAEGGHVPSWQPYATSEEYKKLEPQSNYAAAADAAVYDPPGWYSGSGSELRDRIGSSIGAVESGQLSSEAAIAQIHAKLVRARPHPHPPV